jgi:type I restriction enzyme S subunit
MDERKTVTLAEIADDISYGYTESATDEPIGPKFLRITDIASGTVNWEKVPFCPIGDRELAKYRLLPGDIVIARTGTLGANYTLKPSDPQNVVFASYLIRYRINPEKALPAFVGYWLRTPQWNSFVEGVAGGSVQPGANAKVLGAFEFDLPEFSEQRDITSVVGSLDAKIDLLHRQNKTLEAMAETLYRQWCVEEAEDGWEEMRLEQFSTVGIGRTPPRKEQHWFSTDSNDVKWISIKDMAAEGPFIFSTAEYLTEEAVERFRVPVIPKDTVVLSFKMTLGRLKITTEAMLSNEAIAHFRINPDSHVTKEFLYLGLKTYQYETLGSTSTIVDSINSGMIREMVLQIPPEPLLDRFMEQCGPWFEKIKANQVQIKTLTALRDTLLPKLMSGEVRV